MNIVGLGYELVTVLVDRVGVREPADLYRLGDLAWQRISKIDSQSQVKDVLRGSGKTGPLYQTLLVVLHKSGLSELSTITELDNLIRNGVLDLSKREGRILRTLSLATCPKTSIEDGRTRPRIGEKDATKLERAIETSKSITLERFIYALGIRHVGEEIARLLAKEFGDLDGFLTQNWSDVLAKKIEAQKENEKRKRRQEALLTEPLRGLGEKILAAIGVFLSEQQNLDAIARLRNAGVRPVAPVLANSAVKGPFAGKRVLFTGSFEKRMSRPEAEDLLRRQGADVASGFRTELDYVIYGTKPGSKLKKAIDAGIPTIDQDEFFRMLDDTK